MKNIDEIKLKIHNYTVKSKILGIKPMRFEILDDGRISLVGAESELDVVEIPDFVSYIDKGAFEGNHYIRKVIIPESVNVIGVEAFNRCISLEEVIIEGEKLIFINKGAFRMCKSLKKVNLPDSVYNIDDEAFSNCTLIDNIVLPNKLSSIGKGAFGMCQELKSIAIPDTVKLIPDFAFSYCSSLVGIKLGKNIAKISNSAFKDCNKLQEIIIPDSVESIGESAFLHTSIKEVTIPKQCLVRSKAFNTSIIVHRKSE